MEVIDQSNGGTENEEETRERGKERDDRVRRKNEYYFKVLHDELEVLFHV